MLSYLDVLPLILAQVGPRCKERSATSPDQCEAHADQWQELIRFVLHGAQAPLVTGQTVNYNVLVSH